MEKKYWKGVEELNNDPAFLKLRDNEFAELLPLRDDMTAPRRDFLKFLGFGVAAASLAACQAPVRKAIPYLVKPDEITPGVPNYYASTFYDGRDYASVLVKTREGRPIKIEANEQSDIGPAGTHARTQASVLGLYDSARLGNPVASGTASTWNDVDAAITKKLAEVDAAQGKIRILSGTVISPATREAIDLFIQKHPTTRHIQYDAVSFYGIRKAHALSFGQAVIPAFRFDRASVIVGFECDFLGNWVLPAEHARQYALTRRLSKDKKDMSRHIQFEANLSMTGSNADKRYKMSASEHGQALVSLYNKLAAKAGANAVSGSAPSVDEGLAATAEELWAGRGQALVVSGSNDVHDQVMVCAINSLLDSYGSTLDLGRACNLHQGNDEAVTELLREVNAGEVGALIFYNTNPVYTLPDGETFAGALKKVGLTVTFADRVDETAAHCQYICPDHHYLESWNDAEPFRGLFSTTQPCIRPLFNTRQAQQSLLTWAGAAETDFHRFLVGSWMRRLGSLATEGDWMKVLQAGVYKADGGEGSPVTFAGDLAAAATGIGQRKKGDVEVVLYEKVSMGNGSQANNPWLQELPDPVSKITWDNYFAVSITYAGTKGLRTGNIIELKAGDKTLRGPVFVQPGIRDNTVALALGYGRTHAGKAGDKVGMNAFRLTEFRNGTVQYVLANGAVSKTVEDDYPLSGTQLHHTMMGRNHDIIKETTLAEWRSDASAGNVVEEITTYKGKMPPGEVDLWATPDKPGFPKPNHLWGMVIDLNACTGCGACVVACTAENNVPVVGKDEIGRSREMHWIRIDRYYSSDADPVHGEGKKDYEKMEEPSDDPQVVFQPLMCLHCNHAPCETVCPVAATPHSSDGINMMAYNRCVGTRYCANNCPYKVRRFNWFRYADNDQFDFNMNDPLGKMVLNPDVVVRSRGVMEKCSMCAQRIQAGKLQAKKESRRPHDGEIRTACAQACPTQAITFGDYNDASSRLAALNKDERVYDVLAALDTKPNVKYLVKVRNTAGEPAKHTA